MEETRPQQITNEPIGFPGVPMSAPSTTPSKNNWKWLIILVLFLIVIGGVTFFVFKSSKSSSSDTATPEATSGLTDVQTPEPTATPAAVDKSKVNISVLNGTGIAGEAGILTTQLKDLGYTNVTPGNASTQNSTDTQVTFSSSMSQDVINEITAKLQSIYTSVTTGNSALPSGTDIQVITGLRKGQTSAPAATDTPAPTATPAQ
jgi:hypothetical protein